MRPTWRSIVVLSMLVLAPACSQAEGQGAVRLLSHDDTSREPSRVEISGVTIEVAAEVKGDLAARILRGSEHNTVTLEVNAQGAGEVQQGSAVWFRGWAVRLEDGVLRIGPRDYGAVARGDRVEVGPTTVRVNDAERGLLPPPR